MLKLARTLALLPLAATLAFGQGLSTNATKEDWEEINFEFNSSVLSDGYPSLLRLAELLGKHSDYRVRLEGNTDRIGSERYNEKLGMARAETVKSFLVKYGARAEQISTITQGKRQPKAAGDSKEGRFINRRVQMVVTDGQGRTVSAGGVGDAIRAMDQTAGKAQQDCCSEILKRLDRLDDIVNMLKGMANENAGLRKDLDALKQEQADLKNQVAGLPKPLSRPEVTDITRTAAAEASESARMKRFSLLGLNVGADTNRDVTFTGKGRFFAPFKENHAVQIEGEYMYFRDHQEGQFDLGIVNRFRNFQAGLFSSFKHVNISDFNRGGTLGQAAFTADYLFSRGRVGLFGTKGFLDDVEIGRKAVFRNTVFDITSLKIVDQVGASTAIGLVGNTYVEANLGYLKSQAHADRPGGTIRIVHPISDRWAFTLEGSMNESLLGRDNRGRVVAGFQFGNFMRPKEFVGMSHPVPADIPRVRYELVTRRVRTGNEPPVADAGPDQVGVNAGTVVLDGSGSFDPEGDPITYQWQQIAGPMVALAGANTAKASFEAAEGQSYSFRLTVRDDRGAQAIARVSVTTARAPQVRIVRFQASPTQIRAGQSSVISWQVQDADTVDITEVGRVDPRSGTSSVSPNETTTYRITARNRVSEVSETVTVSVERPEVRILNFQATPTNITAGESATLSWRTENAESVEITGVGSVDRDGSTVVSPTQTTSYTLTARNRFGQITSTVTVRVTPAPMPRIVRFTAAPTEIVNTEFATLVWLVENADTVTISGLGNVGLTGSSNVNPLENTTYTLTARNAQGETTATVTVAVVKAATIGSCVANPSTSPRPGSPVTLTWVAQNAAEVMISGVGSVPAAGPATVNPVIDTLYTITAIGRRSQASCQVSVRVTTTTQPPTGQRPVANAGPNQVTTTTEVKLDGSKSLNPSGGLLGFSWRVLKGADVQILGADTPTPTVRFRNLAFGEYIFELTVTDQFGQFDTATTRVMYAAP